MRSSIACARCRRSKVKCINNGVNTTCRACETSGRECTYPAPAAGGAGGAARRESIIAGQQPGDSVGHGEAPRRPRPRKAFTSTAVHGHSNKESPRPLLDALDPQLLTPKVWTELFEIFQQHFSTDLPFLHPPTFLKNVRQTSLQSSSSDSMNTQPASSSLPPASPSLLLSFLALTARFHPVIVAHHSPATSSRPSNPIVASEYYAAAARSRLSGQYGDELGTPTLERTQSLLMLGLHDWGMCQGVKAWVSIGVAIRSAQVLGLQFEQELDDMPLARSLAMNDEIRHMGVSPDRLGRNTMLNRGDEFIEQEIRRRTFWSCFIMDRYLSSGKYRPSMLNVQDLRIQLPSSERAFLFGEKVRTSLLGDDGDGIVGRAQVQSQRRASVMLGARGGDLERGQEDENAYYDSRGGPQASSNEDNTRWEVGQDEGVLSRFIRALDMYGTIVKWSCAGGRRREKHPPWDPRSHFYNLQRQLTAFKESLPRHLSLNPANISAHIASRTSTPYTLMHTVHLLCSIMLHREYVPFIPLRCSKPQGPLDSPLFPPDQYEIPPGFWDDSARECFKAARDLIDLLRTCQEYEVLVETPIVGFATYTVAFCGVYCINFPWMDPHGFMCKRQPDPAQVGYTTVDSSGAEAARKALELVGQLRKRLQMADGWFKTIKRVHLYFVRLKKDFQRNTRMLEASSESGSSSESYRYLSLREGGAGGGLEEYKLLEKILKEFGSLEDEDHDMLDGDSDGVRLGHGLDETSETGSAAIKSENMELAEGTPESASVRQERWNAINTVAAAAGRAEGGVGTPSMANGQVPNHYSHHLGSPTHATSAPTHSEFRAPYGSPQTSNQMNPPAQSYPPNPAESAQRASLNLHTQLGHPGAANTPQQSHAELASTHGPKWSPATKDAWLNNLETPFGGDDLAAFTQGGNWEDWVMQSKERNGGWLSAVWGGAGG